MQCNVACDVREENEQWQHDISYRACVLCALRVRGNLCKDVVHLVASLALRPVPFL